MAIKEVSTAPAISICRDPGLEYPGTEEHSPAEIFPEYPFPSARAGSSGVYGLVRRCLRDIGADASNFGSPGWNPLGDWIEPGSSVFLLPNLVVNQRPSEPLRDFEGKCTHGSAVRAVLDYAVRATGDARKVAFGNASLQSCDYERVSEEAGMTSVARFYRDATGAEVGPVDLRAVVTQWTRYGALLSRKEQRVEDVVLVDLGSDSLLDEFYDQSESVEMRVSDYDHREMAKYHDRGRHIYAIHRAVLNADVIISVPKLKTHEKVGITCALKGTVGTIARKECLAHHRKGGPGQRGDEYPRGSLLRGLASSLADRVTTLDSELLSNAARIPSKALYRMLRFGRKGIMAGAWYGNDTAWRMALDISRILRYARPDGSMAAVPQRQHLVVVDGVVGGEADGPVYPRGIRVGTVIFGTDPVWTDYSAAMVMGFDPASIPLIDRAADPIRWPVTDADKSQVRLVVNGTRSDWLALSGILERAFVPPKGWVGHVGRIHPGADPVSGEFSRQTRGF
jgi:uncharacterized protein (DUF362 family)